MAPIPQSDTRWVKKPGKAGYVEQISTGKRVTGKIALSTTVGSGGKKIANKRGISDYSAGRNVTKSLAKTSRTIPSGDSKKIVKKNPPSITGATPNPRGADTVSSQSQRPVRVGGVGLRGIASARGAYGTGSGSTKRVGIAPKPKSVPTPKRPLTAAERAKQTGGVNAYGMMGGSEGNVRPGRNKTKDGVFAPEFRRSASPAERAAAQARADAAAKSRRSTEERFRAAASKESANRRARMAAANKLAEEKKKSSGPKIGDTKPVSAGVGYVQTQKYTKNGWVNVGPKRRSK